MSLCDGVTRVEILWGNLYSEKLQHLFTISKIHLIVTRLDTVMFVPILLEMCAHYLT